MDHLKVLTHALKMLLPRMAVKKISFVSPEKSEFCFDHSLLVICFCWSASNVTLGNSQIAVSVALVEPVDTKRIDSLEKFCDLEKELQSTSIYTSNEE